MLPGFFFCEINRQVLPWNHSSNRFLFPDFQVSLPFNEKQQADTNCLFIFLPDAVAYKIVRADTGRQCSL